MNPTVTVTTATYAIPPYVLSVQRRYKIPHMTNDHKLNVGQFLMNKVQQTSAFAACMPTTTNYILLLNTYVVTKETWNTILLEFLILHEISVRNGRCNNYKKSMQ